MRFTVQGTVYLINENQVVDVNLDLRSVTFKSKEDAKKFANTVLDSVQKEETVYTDSEIYNQIFK